MKMLSLMLSVLTASAEPFLPANDSVVVAKLPASLTALRGVRQNHAAGKPADLASTLLLAREYLQIAQQTSDPAFVRYAEGLLAPWQTEPAAGLRFLQAVIRQHQHRFAEALDLLDQALHKQPADEEALLLKAAILNTLGRYADVKMIFARHLKLASTLRGLTLLLTATSLNGSLEVSERTLERAVTPASNTAEQAFALSVLGEMALRRGDAFTAESRFKQALALQPADAYTLAAYADLLIAASRKDEVLGLIDLQCPSEALQTRRLIAERAGRNQTAPWERQLLASGHLRELALLQLELTGERELALTNAVANWKLQKEPIDALLLLRTAIASGQAAAAKPLLQWLQDSHLQDERIKALTTKAEQSGTPEIRMGSGRSSS